MSEGNAVPQPPEDLAGALSGVRVVDIGRLIGGPFSATLLGELGAEVVKVETPKGGDALRTVGVQLDDDRSAIWLVEARNKKSVTIDLTTDEGRELLKKLLAEADVLIENSRPGWLESIGLDDETRTAINPSLVTARVSGYGQSGPKSNRPLLDRQAIAVSGLGGLTGFPDGPPVKPGAFVADYSTGLYAAFLVLAALREVDRTGRGQTIDLALFEFPFRMTSEWITEYDHTGQVRPRQGNQSAAVAPSDAFESADGVWLMIACSTDKTWHRLASLMELGDELMGAFEGQSARVQRRDEVNALVSEWVGARSGDTVESDLETAGVPCARFYGPEDVMRDDHFVERGVLARSQDSSPDVVVPAPVGRMSRTPASIRWDGPKLGEHTDEILGSWLGLDQTALDRLRSDQVI